MSTPLTPKDWQDNLFSAIGDGWMLITATKPDGSFNTMTASWGGGGIFWGKPVVAVGIRPERYTYEFAEADTRLSLSFFDGHREALRLCGTKSGRDCDKVALSGLTPVRDREGYVYFAEAKTVALGRKLYADDLKEGCFSDPSLLSRWYSDGGLHRIYVCEIEELFHP